MSKVKERPNFTISYRTPTEIDYEEFKDDFCNTFISVEDMKNKYDLTPSEFREYRRRVMDETGLKRKPRYTYAPIHFFSDAKFIQKKSNGYIVVKKFVINHEIHARYYGRYADYDTAKMVRDKLVESNWDDRLGDYLKNKYGLKQMTFRPAYDKAVLVYPEFKELYLHSSLKVNDIKKKLNIGQRAYNYCLNMVREELGDINYRRVPRK